VPYSLAMRMVENPATFKYYFSLYIQAGLASLVKAIGNLDFRDVLIERPGQPKVYFGDCENIAGYDLRIYVKRIDSDSSNS